MIQMPLAVVGVMQQQVGYTHSEVRQNGYIWFQILYKAVL